MSHTPRPRFVLPHEQLTLSICRSVDGSMAASAGSSHASGFVSRRSGSALAAVESWPVETSLSVHTAAHSLGRRLQQDPAGHQIITKVAPVHVASLAKHGAHEIVAPALVWTVPVGIDCLPTNQQS